MSIIENFMRLYPTDLNANSTKEHSLMTVSDNGLKQLLYGTRWFMYTRGEYCS